MKHNQNLISNWWFFALIIVYIVLGFATLATNDSMAQKLFDEDKYFENMGAVGFFATSFVFISGLWQTRTAKKDWNIRLRQLLFAGLAFVFFFGGGEEISWGQRILNIQTPEALAEINAQGETNIHNIEVFEFGLQFETIFDLMWGALTLAFPIAVYFSKPLRTITEKIVLAPRIRVGILFVFNYLWAKVAAILFESFYAFGSVPFVQAIQEVKESNYALLFVLVALELTRDLNEA